MAPVMAAAPLLASSPSYRSLLMASTRFALGKVLDSVGAAAGTVTTVLQTAESAVNMLANSIEHAEFKQQVRHTTERDGYIESIIREASAEEAKAIEGLRKLQEKGEFSAEDYTSAESRIRRALISKGLLSAPQAA